jgi:3-dehydrosphinganine reductase
MFITGGSSGIGLALARIFVLEGANVALLARRKELLESARLELVQLRREPEQTVVTIAADVANLPALLPKIESFESEFGSPDYLFNCAGVTYPGKFHTLSYDTIHDLMDINYLGTAYVTRALIGGMLKRGSGHIVNISSMAGVIGTYGYSAYGASKYAIRGFSDVLRAEYKMRGIKVSVVFPPDTETPQLEFEKDLKPAITRELSDTAGVMNADVVAKIIWKDVQRNRYTILPGFNSWFLYTLVSVLGDLAYPVMDFMINQAIRTIIKRRK